MSRITQEQYSELKNRGLSDQKIQTIAKQKGFDLPLKITGGTTGIKGFSTGFAKGGLEIARGTAQALQGLGQRELAAISPFSLEEIREKTGFESLDERTPSGAAVSEALKAKTPSEKLGKVAANVATFFIPTAKATQVGGRAIKGVGETVSKFGIEVSAKEAPLLQAYQAKYPLAQRITAVLKGERLAGKPILARETALRKGIAGTESMIGVQARRGAENLWKEVVSPALQKSTKKVNMKNFINEIGKQVDKIDDLSRQRELKTALQAFRNDFGKVGEITLEKLQKFKEGWAKFLPDKVYKGKPIAGSFREIQNIAAQLARNVIYESVDDVGIKAAYLDYGNLKNLQLLGQRAMTGSKFKGGFGGFVSGALDTAITPIASFGGLTLYKAGKTAEFMGIKGLKTVGRIFGL